MIIWDCKIWVIIEIQRSPLIMSVIKTLLFSDARILPWCWIPMLVSVLHSLTYLHFQSRHLLIWVKWIFIKQTLCYNLTWWHIQFQLFRNQVYWHVKGILSTMWNKKTVQQNEILHKWKYCLFVSVKYKLLPWLAKTRLLKNLSKYLPWLFSPTMPIFKLFSSNTVAGGGIYKNISLGSIAHRHILVPHISGHNICSLFLDRLKYESKKSKSNHSSSMENSTGRYHSSSFFCQAVCNCVCSHWILLNTGLCMSVHSLW